MPLIGFVSEVAGQQVVGNTVGDLVVAVAIFVVFVLLFRWVQRGALYYLERMARRTRGELDDALVAVVRTIRPPFYFYVGFYLALQYLHIAGAAQRVVHVVLLVWLVYHVVVALQIVVDYYVQRRLARAHDGAARAATHVIRGLTGVVLWVLGVLFVLSNLGVEVTSLIAGLGIGGLAVALAAQRVLGDLFSSLSIYFDRPFVPGDFITFGDVAGTVQKVGVKTTRLLALSGEEVIVPNTEITAKSVRNFGRMSERRVEFSFRVAQQTPTEALRRIPALVQSVIEQQPQARFDRCHLLALADGAPSFEAAYFVTTKKYRAYVDTHQAVLLGIREAFEREHIELV